MSEVADRIVNAWDALESRLTPIMAGEPHRAVSDEKFVSSVSRVKAAPHVTAVRIVRLVREAGGDAWKGLMERGGRDRTRRMSEMTDVAVEESDDLITVATCRECGMRMPVPPSLVAALCEEGHERMSSCLLCGAEVTVALGASAVGQDTEAADRVGLVFVSRLVQHAERLVNSLSLRRHLAVARRGKDGKSS